MQMCIFYIFKKIFSLYFTTYLLFTNSFISNYEKKTHYNLIFNLKNTFNKQVEFKTHKNKLKI